MLDNKIDVVITYCQTNKSPWFNMINYKKGLLKKIINSKTKIIRRQDAPEVFSMTTVAYVTTPKFIMKSKNIFDGKIKGIEIPKNRAVDIDDKFDFQYTEYLLNKNNQ